MTKRTKATKAVTADKDNHDLLLRHEVFIEAYLGCLNGTQAYQEAYPGVDYNTASVNASKLLRNTKIKAELEKRFSQLTMGKKEVLARLMKLANASLLPFIKVDDDGFVYFNFADPAAKHHLYLVKKIKSKKQESYNEKTGQGNEEKWIEVELHDAMKALELIGKYHALFTDKTEQTDRKIIRVTIAKQDE